MNHFISGILKIVLLEASAAALLFDRVLPDRYAKHRRNAFVVLAGLMVFAWGNYGALRGGGNLVHGWEQFHFYLGAKYQAEVGWFDLYKAAVVADAESARVLNIKTIRDISTFEVVPVQRAFDDAARIKAKFEPARWEAFKADWVAMTRQPGNWGAILQDHGNSNSPAWAILAHPIASLVPLTPGGQAFIGLLDMLLMGGLWWFVYRTFGVRTASIGLFVWAVPPIVFDYLAGSFLRWDWLFALGMAMCFLHKERFATAGAFFGFAVATKLFPLFFGVALLFRALVVFRREGVFPKRYLRFAAGTVAAGAGAVVLSSAMFGTFDVWREYKARIEVAQVEKFYSIQYSLRPVFLQVAESRDGQVLREGLWPSEIKQARADVDIADHAVGFKVVQLLFTALVFLLVLRANDVEAFALGPLLVFTWLVVNMYYWNMLGLLALGLATRKDRPAFGALLGLHLIFAFFYLYQHTNHGFSEGFAVATLMALGIVLWGVAELRQVRGELPALLGLGAAPAAKRSS